MADSSDKFKIFTQKFLYFMDNKLIVFISREATKEVKKKEKKVKFINSAFKLQNIICKYLSV